MRRRILLTASASLLTAACGGKPISYLVTTPQPSETVYGCALRKMNELGYTITNTSREAAFVAGTKQTSGTARKIFTGDEYHDQLTVSVFDDTKTGQRTMRATTGRVNQKSNLFGTSSSSIDPSDTGKQDANDLLLACGEGAVSKQPTGNQFEAPLR
ncbi:MAG TPA: hypothetical protein VGM82_00095 [Gemmatimonadaceae bacterium]|jgi:hypothetical protein